MWTFSGISEYKWTRFQFKDVKLIYLDVYHSSTRGMAGSHLLYNDFEYEIDIDMI